MKTKIIVASLFAVFTIGTVVHADNYGLDITAKEAGLNMTRSAPQLVGNVIGAGLSFISVIFFALMIWGGLQWMLARGNDEQAKKAQTTIYGAVIGLIIVLASYALTNFVFQSVESQQSSGGSSSGNTVGQTYCLNTDNSQCFLMTGQPCVDDAHTFSSLQACEASRIGGSADLLWCQISSTECSNSADINAQAALDPLVFATCRTTEDGCLNLLGGNNENSP